MPHSPTPPESPGSVPGGSRILSAEQLLSLEDVRAFGEAVLEAVAERYGALHAGLWMPDEASSRSVRLVDEQRGRVGQATLEKWRPELARRAHRALNAAEAVVFGLPGPPERPGKSTPCHGLALTLSRAAPPAAALTFVVPAGEPEAKELARAVGDDLAAETALWQHLHGAPSVRERYEELCRAWDLVASATAGYPDPDHMALAAVNKAKELLPVSRVSLGWLKRDKVRLAAVSEQDYVDRRSTLARTLAAAMEEATELGEPVFFPPERGALAAADPEPAGLFPVHAELADITEDQAIATYPLRAGGEVTGAIVFERREATRFDTPQKRLQSLAADHLGPPLALARRDARGPLTRARDGFVVLIEKLTGEGHVAAKVGVALVVLAILVGVFGRAQLTVNGECRLQPAVRRVFGAPFDGVLSETFVVPGDLVEQGDILCAFDDDELQLALREARSKLIATEKQRDLHLAEQNLAEFKIAQAKADQLAAEIALLRHRIDQAEVRATFRGVVLSGDLRQSIGSPFRMGEQLVEVAPLDELMLLVEVDQSDVDYVEARQEGTFATRARPARTLPFTVERVRPMSEASDGDNVFIVEARIPNAEGWLRPGMEGAASVRAGKHNFAWVRLRKLVGWLRLKLFF